MYYYSNCRSSIYNFVYCSLLQKPLRLSKLELFKFILPFQFEYLPISSPYYMFQCAIVLIINLKKQKIILQSKNSSKIHHLSIDAQSSIERLRDRTWWWGRPSSRPYLFDTIYLVYFEKQLPVGFSFIIGARDGNVMSTRVSIRLIINRGLLASVIFV